MRVKPGVSRSEAVRRAVEDSVQRKRIKDFMALAGSRLVDMDWKDAEQRDLRKLKRHGRKTLGRDNDFDQIPQLHAYQP